jgi:hypothetical protein
MLLPEKINHFEIKEDFLVVCGFKNIFIYDIKFGGSVTGCPDCAFK